MIMPYFNIRDVSCIIIFHQAVPLIFQFSNNIKVQEPNTLMFAWKIHIKIFFFVENTTDVSAMIPLATDQNNENADPDFLQDIYYFIVGGKFIINN